MASIDDVTDLTPRVQYTAAAAQTTFDYPFPIFEDADLVVDIDGTTKTLTTDYTVTGAGANLGGTIVLVAAATGGEIVTIYRDITLERTTDYQQNGPLTSSAVNDELDRLTLVDQQLQERINRALRIPITAAVADADIELAVANWANKYLSFDVNGKPTPAALSATTMTQEVIGSLAHPQSQDEIDAAVTPTYYAYPVGDLRRYGGVGDGVTDNATPLTSLIAVLSVTGGEGYIPPGAWAYSAFPALTNKQSIVLVGESSTNSGLARASRLVYTGTASPIITAASAQGIVFKNLQLIHNNASFNGTYIKYGNDGAHGDSSYCYLIDCFIGANLGTGQVHLDLDETINFTAERCQFFHGAPSVKGQAAAGGSYSNAIRFRDCEWNICTVAPVYDPGQAWTFDGCIFENLSTNAAGAILSSNGTTTQVSGLLVRGCWFGDATTGGTWIDISGQSIAIEGNYFGGNATATAINLRTIHGVSIRSNTFDTFSVCAAFSGSCADVEVKANVLTGVTTPLSGGANVATGYADVGCNFGGGTLGTTHQIIGNNGFMALPNRIIEQWGSLTLTIGTPQAVTFATNGIAFPNACFNVVLTMQGPPGTANAVWISVAPSTTGFTVNGGGTAGAVVVYWRAVGY